MAILDCDDAPTLHAHAGRLAVEKCGVISRLGAGDQWISMGLPAGTLAVASTVAAVFAVTAEGLRRVELPS